MRDLRQRYRRAATSWLSADPASGHLAKVTRTLAARLRIQFLWLPKQTPECNPMDQLWRELKRLVAANRQAQSVDALADDAVYWTLGLITTEARHTADMMSTRFWLHQS